MKRLLLVLLTAAVLVGCQDVRSSSGRSFRAEVDDVATPPDPSVTTIAASPDADVAEPQSAASVTPGVATEPASDPADFADPIGAILAANNATVSAPGDPAAAGGGVVTPPGQPLPGGVRILIPERQLLSEAGALRLTFDDLDLLKVINMDPVTPDAVEKMPDWLRGLEGQRIRLRGWMAPTFSDSGLQRFLFTRDNGTCCFGPKAKVYDKLGVALAGDTTTDYISGRPFDVEGVIHIEYKEINSDLKMLYTIREARISE